MSEQVYCYLKQTIEEKFTFIKSRKEKGKERKPKATKTVESVKCLFIYIYIKRKNKEVMTSIR